MIERGVPTLLQGLAETLFCKFFLCPTLSHSFEILYRFQVFVVHMAELI